MMSAMQEPMISVIVPVYKVEKYLDECVRSIMTQEYQNLEIILIDDGSPDDCPQMCDEFAREDPRIRVIHQENAGLSAARNAGLDAASGEIITFIDSDDVAHPSMIKVLHENMVAYGADISECKFATFFDKSQSECEKTTQGIEAFVPGSDYAKEALRENSSIILSVCAKLYKMRLFYGAGIRFPLGRYYEDAPVSFELACAACHVVRCGATLYGYRQRQGSIVFSMDRDPSWFERKTEDMQYVRVCFQNIISRKNLPFADAMEGYEARDMLLLLRDVVYWRNKDLRQKYYPLLRDKVLVKKREYLRNPCLSSMRKWEIRILSIGAIIYIPVVYIVCGRNRRI